LDLDCTCDEAGSVVACSEVWHHATLLHILQPSVGQGRRHANPRHNLEAPVLLKEHNEHTIIVRSRPDSPVVEQVTGKVAKSGYVAALFVQACQSYKSALRARVRVDLIKHLL
jgi:hypothetical protein